MQKSTPQDELTAYQSIQNALRRLKTGRLTNTQALAIRDLISLLDQKSAFLSEEVPELELPTLADEDLKFLQEMKASKLHPEILQSLRQAMESVITNPNRGMPFPDCIYSGLFKNKMPEHTGKALIFKLHVRLKYRLIYAYGGSLERPVFLDFNHRKDIYKHAGFGYSSS